MHVDRADYGAYDLARQNTEGEAYKLFINI